ncbi:MAG: hypothetical protein ACOYKM_00030 [Caulobacterales bacterium]
MQYVSSSSRKAGKADAVSARATPPVSAAGAAESRQAMMQAKLGARVDVTGKINYEMMRMGLFMAGLAGLGIYAHDFVIEGIMAKAALNLTIVGTMLLAAGLCFKNVWSLRNDKLALDALRADFGGKRPTEDIVNTPAIVFKKPELLGYGYRLVTEELLARDKGQLPTETIHIIVQDVDHKVKEISSLMGYFGGLLVFLGLLGAFMGLMKTVHSVGDLIGGLDMSGAGGADAMATMIEGMKKPLAGMSVGFSSSLFGLMFSMVIGVLDRFAGSAIKTVRNEFEACLIDLAHLEMAGDEGGHGHGAHHQFVAPAHAHGVAPMDAVLMERLIRQIEASQHQASQTNELLTNMNATLYAVANGLRQADVSDGRRQLAAALDGVSRSQRDLAIQLTTMASDGNAQQERMANALQANVRTQEEVHSLLQDLAARVGGLPEGHAIAAATAALKQASAQVSAGPAAPAPLEGPVMIGRSQAAAPAAGGGPLSASPLIPALATAAPNSGPMVQMPQVPVDANESGARALMARLAMAIGQRKPSGAAARGISEDRHKQLERAMLTTQQMSRQVLKRLDDTRREEAKTAVTISRAQRQVIVSLDMLVKRLDDLMEGGEIVAKGRIEHLSEVLGSTKAQVATSIDRLEAQVSAGRRTAERAETAANEAAKAARAQFELRKAVGE